MKKYAVLPFLYSFLVLFSGNLLAHLTIGYVNIELAFSQEHEVKKYLAEVKEEEDKIEQAKLKAQAEIQAEMAKFSKLDDKAKQTQQIALGKKIEALQAQFDQQKAELTKKYQAKHEEFLKKNQLLSDAISAERKYDLTLNSMAIASASEAAKKNDITAELVKRYNKAYVVAPEKTAPPASKTNKAKGP